MANIAVIGATGNVGREVLSIIGEMCFSNGKNGDDGDGFVVDKIFALASTSSSGKHVSMTLQKQIQVQALENFDFEKNKVDIAFFCAGSAVSEKYIPKIIGKGGKRIAELERDIGIKMNVEPLEKAPDSFESRLAERSQKKNKSKKNKKEKKNKKLKKSQLKEYNKLLKEDNLGEDTLKDYNKNNYFDLTDNDDSENHNKDYDDSYEDYDEFEENYEELFYDIFELFPEIRKDHVVLPIGKKYVGKSFDILIEEEYIFTATVGKRGYVKLHKNLDLSDKIIVAMDKGERIIAKVRD